jgi:ATP-binding cassette subfamily B protein
MNDPLQPTAPQSAWRLWKATWEATSGDRSRFYFFLFICFTAYSIDLLSPWAIGWTLSVFKDAGVTQEAFDKGMKGIGAYVGLRLVHGILHHYSGYLRGTVAYTARFRKLEEVFSTLLHFPLKWHVSNHSGENLSRLNRSVGAVESLINNYLWQLIDGIVKFFFATAALFEVDFTVALTVLTMGTVTVLIMLLFNARLTKNIRRNNRFYDKLNRTCVDYLYNIITVKTLHLEQPATAYLAAQRADGYRICRKIWKYQELKWGSIGIGNTLVMGASLVIFFYNRKGVGNSFEIGTAYVLIDYLNRIFGAVSSFTGYYGGIIEAATAYDDAATSLDVPQIIDPHSRPRRIARDWSTLTLNDVEFSYGGDLPNLKGVSLEIRHGEKIALVGPSGSGKSTLLKVMAGMLSIQNGYITDQHGSRFEIDDLAAISLLVPQEPEVFSESVRFNMSFGQDFSEQEMQRALEVCRIDYLLGKLPNGWDSNLEESGLNISGGERQRLALARGVLRVPGKDILLLDEPTSSLDPMTEKQIFAGILHHFSVTTVIMACHRLSLVPMFDKVVYLRDGKIEEYGTFHELRAAGRGFAAAWADYERTIVTVESAA